jgi:Family of unknown function (DUF5947)
MSGDDAGNGKGNGKARPIDDMVASRKRANMVSSLRERRGTSGGLAPSAGGDGGADPDAEYCDLCSIEIPPKHEHLLHLSDRRILCVCATCWAQRSADPELRPTGNRTVFLDGFSMSDEIWARLQVPIGLAFFMDSTSVNAVVAMYPSPAGATESELDLSAWQDLKDINPVLESLEPDAEALVVNRISEPAMYAIIPIDQCYGLVGAIKNNWEGISGGAVIEKAVPEFFEGLRAQARAGR